MAETKHNDSKGYERGAMGIDGKDGCDFVKHPGSSGTVTGDHGGPKGTRGAGELARSAVGGERKIGGR